MPSRTLSAAAGCIATAVWSASAVAGSPAANFPAGADAPVSFVRQVVPILTKAGCNAGGCHGKADGQNGFKLSLLGFEPAEDYEALVNEARGRRVFPAAPERSLLVLKAVGALPHGGGRRIEPDSPFAATLVRWIRQGMPRSVAVSGAGESEAVALEVRPAEAVMPKGAEQALAVIARFADGSAADVTELTQFESGDPEAATVSEAGRVRTAGKPGTVGVMARYGQHVALFRAVVPTGAVVDRLPPARNFLDEIVFARLRKLGLPPSDPCDDGTFLRRATLDICGRLPTRAETDAFLADAAPDKHEKLIDRLLADPGYADYFAAKWNAILRNRRRSAKDDPAPTQAFHKWIRDSLADNKPYDVFVREVLTAAGEEIAVPPALWYREVRDVYSQTEDAAQLFLGQRIACARCHHHPMERWTQEDYFGMAAFFSRLEIKDAKPLKKGKKGQPDTPGTPFTVGFKPGRPQATHPRTNKPVPPTGLGGSAVPVAQDADPRAALAGWMTAPDNPYFARMLVNRYWKHFFGRGIVEPEDDLRATNPASHPDLLDALAKRFVEDKYDIKKLIRVICTSTLYRLSAVPNRHNAADRANFSRYIPKRLPAEVLLDAIDTVAGTKTNFKGAPSGVARAVQLPDNLVDSYFLSVFGRPDNASACECERGSDATLAQALHMFNSADVLAKVSGPRAKALAADKRPHEQRLAELYLIALSREPSKEELAALLAHIQGKGKDVQAAYEDILWAVINGKEFVFNH